MGRPAGNNEPKALKLPAGEAGLRFIKSIVVMREILNIKMGKS